MLAISKQEKIRPPNETVVNVDTEGISMYHTLSFSLFFDNLLYLLMAESWSGKQKWLWTIQLYFAKLINALNGLHVYIFQQIY